MKDDLEQLLRSLHLRKIADIFDDEVKRADKAETSYQEFVARLMRAQWQANQEAALTWRIKRAGLPEQWTLETFPFKRQPGVNARQLRAFAELEFVTKAENIVFIGPTGVGKTGLASALLLSVLDRRVRDGVLRRLIDRWLQAGVMESGQLTVPDEGTPQGGVISPLLANVFLHDVLDLWVEDTVRPRLRGKLKLIRYADDFVLLIHNKEDVPRVMSALAKRLERFGLRLHPDKTRALSFDSPWRGTLRAQRSRSFDFLGLTHYWAPSRKGNWVVKQRTAKDRFSRASVAAKERCRRLMHAPLAVQHRALSLLLRGHYGYYGITGNGDALARFRHEVERHWGRALARRDGRRFAWARFKATLKRLPLPMPRPPRSVAPSEPVA
jgi:RNA-directed DNA polymerase